MKTNSMIWAAALLLAVPTTFAQNLNPTVEVTNTYQGKPSDIIKPQIGMAIPDSLMRFDLDFDYEVFENPYQGAYSFKPYLLNMRPGKDAYRGKSLYLRTGAGFQLRPELEFVLSPEQKSRFQMSFYASHRSFFGRYHKVAPAFVRDLEGGSKLFRFDRTGQSFKGHESYTSAGFDGRMNWDRSVLSLGAGYYGVASKDTVYGRGCNAADFYARMASRDGADPRFFYNVGLSGRIGYDRLKYALPFSVPEIRAEKNALNETFFSLDGSFGPVLDSARRVIVDFSASTCSYEGLVKGHVGRVSFTPKYQFRKGRWDVRLGLRLDLLARGNNRDSLGFTAISQHEYQTLFPDVHLEYLAILDRLAVYASTTGGNNLNTYSSSLEKNPHFAPSFCLTGAPLLDNSIEHFNVALGVRGNFAARLRYDLRIGARKTGNGQVDAVLPSALPVVAYMDYSQYYGDLILGWKSARIDVDAGCFYRNTLFTGNETASPAVELAPPAWSGFVKAVYHFNPRIYAGFSVEASSARNGYADAGDVLRIPGWVDPGVLAGYWFNRTFGLWVKSGNLAGMNIQRNPLYAAKGAWLTAGIALNM